MCGRYSFTKREHLIALPLGVDIPEDVEARYNIAPSSIVPLVVEEASGRRLERARWGLVPFWADDPSIGSRLTNARAEGVATKPSFRAAFRQRRGLLLADAYFEWQVVPGKKGKQPWCIRLPGDAPFGMAALWERWTPKGQPDAEPLITCAVITTEANEATRDIHHRMPVIIAPDDMARWLDPSTTSDVAESLLRPYGGAMSMWPVSTRVNTTAFDDAELLTPVDAHAPEKPAVSSARDGADEQPTLFQ